MATAISINGENQKYENKENDVDEK